MMCLSLAVFDVSMHVSSGCVGAQACVGRVLYVRSPLKASPSSDTHFTFVPVLTLPLDACHTMLDTAWRVAWANVCLASGTPKKPAVDADIKATNPDQPHVAALQTDIALDGQLQQFVMAPQGLFPAPLPSHLLANSKVLSHFKLLGRAMAKALQDNRLLDLPLSYVFYRCASSLFVHFGAGSACL